MATWADLDAAEARLAEVGFRLLAGDADRPPVLATTRGEGPPRMHPVNVGIHDGRLWTFIGPSAKLRDLEADGRFALHAWLNPAEPNEFVVRGRATPSRDPGIRDEVMAGWPFTPDDSFVLFELHVADASLGERPDPAAWPPRYRRWHAG